MESFFLRKFRDGSLDCAYKLVTGDVLKAPRANRKPWLWKKPTYESTIAELTRIQRSRDQV